MIDIVTGVKELRTVIQKWRGAGDTIGFVPTMGALHQGHMTLIKSARAKAKRTVASVFVNPTQFAPNEDFSKYPRQLENDRKLLSENGCDLLYAPTVEEMYPEGFVTRIEPGPMASVLEGVIRPTHFSGVATVVSKFLLQVAPDFAFFGEKDYQQLLIIKQTVRDLNIPVEIVPVPIARAEDGVARSSRNVYLSDDERQKARVLSVTLRTLAEEIGKGMTPSIVLELGRQRILDAGFALDYLVLCDAETLTPLTKVEHPARALVAAKIGTTRLIDNIAVHPPTAKG